MANLGPYVREVWRRVFATAQLLQRWRLYSSIGSAVLSPVLAWLIGVRMTVWYTLLVSIIGVLLLVTIEILCRFVLIAPAEIWRENQARITTLERDLHASRTQIWPAAFRADTRQALIDKFRGTFGSFAIYHDSAPNCAEFALALHSVLMEAGWMAQRPRPIQPTFQLAAGIRIVGGLTGVNGLTGVLKEILDIDAEANTIDVDSVVQICIGVRRPLV